MNIALFMRLAGREWAHHPWRHAVATLAVALGVALAYSVHLINSSALSEFSAALRNANGEPDLTLRGQREGFDDALYERAALDPVVTAASPVVDVETRARAGAQAITLRLVGIDALQVAAVAPTLLPRPADGSDAMAALDPDTVFLNAAARQQLGITSATADAEVQIGTTWQRLRVAGSVAAGGPPLAVVDIAGAQARFGFAAKLSRIDLRLAAGADTHALIQRLTLPPGVLAAPADESEQRVSNLSRAYRVNLTVLALVALFVGAFLVYSVVALAVAQRTPQLALLGVLGMTAAERRRLVLAECALVGTLGSAIGLLLGGVMAVLALRLLAGDLGGGFFPGIAPHVHVGAPGALVFGLLGITSALVGGWRPALQAERLAPAQALKGLGDVHAAAPRLAVPLALCAAGALLALLPPVAGLPLAAYAAVAALLFGGVAAVPAAVQAVLAALRPRGALPLLAVQRARFERASATAAVAGVVASLALSVALTVMVTSFRSGVSRWLDQILPADLYARSAGTAGIAEQVWLPPDFLAAAARVPGVRRAQGQRVKLLQLAPGRPSVALLARPFDPATVSDVLPFVDPPLPVRSGETGVWVSEPMVSLYGAAPGTQFRLPLAGRDVPVRVLGVWRDYARQFGAIAIDAATYRQLTDDVRINDAAFWLDPGARVADVQAALRRLLPDPAMLEFATTHELRALSLAIFDRSFAVTYYLQAVAVGIGLIGIAASLSAQVLARRKEFGLLAHLGLTRPQVVALVAAEGAAWLAAGTLIGLALGIAVSVVLVFVVNPQSFHWTMPLVLPWPRLAALCGAVLAAGIATAAFSARRAAGRPAVLSVKEDW